MRSGDRGDGLRCRRVVEQHPAATIDLKIDETGCQESAAQLAAPGRDGHVTRGHNAGDPAALDQHGLALDDCLACEDAGTRQRLDH
jgi:hypothetical protein